MQYLLEFTEADLERPFSEPEKLAETVRVMFDGETPVRTMDVAERLQRNYGTLAFSSGPRPGSDQAKFCFRQDRTKPLIPRPRRCSMRSTGLFRPIQTRTTTVPWRASIT